MNRPRLLFYAVDGLGLGHVTRMLALARAVRRLSPGAEMLFLTTSEASHIIYQEGFAALKLPSRTAASSGGLRGGSWLRLTQTVSWNSIAAFDPHCLIVDTFAAGTLQELLPILRWPLRKVFVFRAQRKERASDPFLQRTLELYDLILVPHEAGSETVPTPAGTRAIWTGPILLREASELLTRPESRRALGLPLERDIGLFALGGGGEPEMNRARAQMQRAADQANQNTLWVEVAGPLAPNTKTMQNAALESTIGSAAPAHEYSCARPLGRNANDGTSDAERENGDAAQEDAFASRDNWRTLRGVHPLMIYLNAFDCAVAAVGYNTTHELQAARVPSVLWPFARDLDDQEARALRLASRGCAIAIAQGSGDANEENNGEVIGSDAVSSDATKAADRLKEAELKEAELARALAELARPEKRRQMRDAMDAMQGGAVGNDSIEGDACGGMGNITRRSGAMIGAEAVLQLLP